MTSLAGVRVVVTRSQEDSDSLALALEALGAEVIRLPTIAIEFPDELLTAAESVPDELVAGTYEWIVFSSSAGVRAFARLVQRGDHVDVLGRVQVAAVGSAAADAFRKLMDREVDLVPERFTGTDLARALGEGAGRVLLIRPEEAPRSVVDELRAGGWEPREVALYRTVRGEPDVDTVAKVENGEFDVVTFTSGSTAKHFAETVPTLTWDEHHRVVVIGPSTEAVARQLGMRVDAVAEPHTTAGVVDAVVSVVGR